MKSGSGRLLSLSPANRPRSSESRHGDKPMIAKKILLCTDFSDNSANAEHCAVEFAGAFKADLAILHVIDFWAGIPAAYKEDVRIPVLEVTHEIVKWADEQLRARIMQDQESLGEVKWYSRIGVPAEEIVQLATEQCFDLIVLGTHGRTGVAHAVLGSVAEAVIRAARCPVLVVRSG